MKLWRTLRTLEMPHWPLYLAMTLTVIMTLSALGLLALSGWFLTAASIAGLAAAAGAYSFNILQPSSMIRLLAVTRTVSRYAERLISHDATLHVVVKLRRRVFEGLLATVGRGHRADDESIERLMQDSSVVEGALLRTLLPLLGAWVAALFTPLLAAVIAPAAILPGLIPPIVLWVTLRLRRDAYRHLADELDQAARRARNRALALADGRAELHLALSSSEIERQTNAAYAPLAALRNRRVQMEWIDKMIIGGGHALAFAWLALLPLDLPILVALLLGLLATAELLTPGVAVSYEIRRVELAVARLPEPETPKVQATPSRALVIENLMIAPQMGEPPITEPFSLTLNPGDHIRLEGPSGVGKTTCLRTLAGFIPPHAGAFKRPSSVAFVEQSPWLPADYLWRSLTLGLAEQPTEDAFWQALNLVELDDWVRQLPAQEKTWIGMDGVQPSGGQWRRLALARMVLQSAELVLLDEPTEGLEPALAARILTRLTDLLADRILVVVSHRSETTEAIPRGVALRPKSTQTTTG